MTRKESTANLEATRSTGQLLVGWREKIRLPDWHIRGLVAKLDTGALSSAIDVSSVEELSEERVCFTVAVSRKGDSREKVIEAPILRKIRVRSSFGHAQNRILVATRIRIGPITKMVEFSLARRKNMLSRVLLGRTALAGDFVVDPSSIHLLTNQGG